MTLLSPKPAAAESKYTIQTFVLMEDSHLIYHDNILNQAQAHDGYKSDFMYYKKCK